MGGCECEWYVDTLIAETDYQHSLSDSKYFLCDIATTDVMQLQVFSNSSRGVHHSKYLQYKKYVDDAVNQTVFKGAVAQTKSRNKWISEALPWYSIHISKNGSK